MVSLIQFFSPVENFILLFVLFNKTDPPTNPAANQQSLVGDTFLLLLLRVDYFIFKNFEYTVNNRKQAEGKDRENSGTTSQNQK